MPLDIGAMLLLHFSWQKELSACLNRCRSEAGTSPQAALWRLRESIQSESLEAARQPFDLSGVQTRPRVELQAD